MKRFVLDASVSLAWFLDNPVPDLAQRVRKTLETDRAPSCPPYGTWKWRMDLRSGNAVAFSRHLIPIAVSRRRRATSICDRQQ
jgi:hypothetical protein